MNKYYIVKRSVLPKAFDKVIRARDLLANHQAKNINDATKQVGISRGTYYHYKDAIFSYEETSQGIKVLINIQFKNNIGTITRILNYLDNMNASVIMMNQNLSIHQITNLLISIDISNAYVNLGKMMQDINRLPNVDNVKLVSI